MYFLDELAKYDKEVYDATCLELQRQRDNIELIASENIVSKAVLLAAGTGSALLLRKRHNSDE